MKNVVRTFVIAALVALVTPNLSAATRDVNLSFTVMQWINVVEIYAGKQVMARGENAEVKAFAKLAVEKHTKLAKELGQFAEDKKIEGLDIRKEQDDATVAVLIDHILEAQKLKDLSGAELDKAFAKLMVAVHEFALKNIEDGSSRIGQSEEATFLTGLKAQVQEGLDTSKELATKLGVTIE